MLGLSVKRRLKMRRKTVEISRHSARKKGENFMKNRFFRAILSIAVFSSAAHAQLAAGGAFTLEQTVIATGGGNSAGGAFTVNGTGGQAIAGTRSVDATKGLHGGFWNAAPLAPTAAGVSIGGRVLTESGQGIRSVSVTLTERDGTVHHATTAGFGYYNFTEIASGQVVTIAVSAKRYSFAQSTRLLNVSENASEINFIGASF